MASKIHSPQTLVYKGLIAIALALSSCASIQQPTGGEKDRTPPKVLKEEPANFSTSLKAKEVVITFDEYIKISNESKEFSLSPAMDKSPQYKIKKKSLHIKFMDTLAANTTYTINFGRGLVDYNEGNILKNYSYVFSTGTKIDSLTVSGTVTNSVSQQAVLDATVFLIPVKQDSIFGKRRANIFTTTDSSGNFNLRYLRPDTYRIYALKEEGGDRIYNSTNEEIAFLKDSVNLTKNVSGLHLQLFKEQPERFRVTDRKIESDGKLLYVFNKGLEKPDIRSLHPADLDASKIKEFSRQRDSAYVWLRSMNFDSVRVIISDNGKALDTNVIRRSRRDAYKQDIVISDNLSASRIKPGTDLVLTFSAPVGSIDPSKISLLQDSVPVNGLRVVKDSLSARRYIFKFPWKLQKQYELKLAEKAIGGKFGGESKAYTKQFIRDDDLNYGNLTLTVNLPDTGKSYLLQMLNDANELIHEQILTRTGKVVYSKYSLGKYRFRVVYDENNNGKWDTGSVKDRRYPEKVWNSSNETTLRANWDLEESLEVPPASEAVKLPQAPVKEKVKQLAPEEVNQNLKQRKKNT